MKISQIPEKTILSELDKKILYQLDIDSRQSASELAKKIKSNKNTVNYRINKLIKEDIIKRYTIEINTAKLGYQNIKVYLQFQNFNKQLEKEFIDFLRKTPKIGWIAITKGRWDALFCYWAESEFEFYNSLIKILNKFSKYIYSKEIIHNINWFYYNRKWLDSSSKNIHLIKYGEEPEHIKIDDLDKKILKLLIQDASISIKDMSIKLETNSQNIINRIKNLQKKGVITRFSIDLNYEKLNIMFCKTLMCLENITEPRLKELYFYCSRQPNIFALTTALGAWDLELEFEVNKFEQMVTIMDDLKEKFGDIIKTYESIILNEQTEKIYIGE